MDVTSMLSSLFFMRERQRFPVIRPGLSQQMIKRLLIDLAAAVLVGPQGWSVSGLRSDPGGSVFPYNWPGIADLSQRLGSNELAQKHADQQNPAGEAFD
jgi:hypothetical protein